MTHIRQFGLEAWMKQRHSRRASLGKRLVGMSVIVATLAVALPDTSNPLVLLGLVQPRVTIGIDAASIATHRMIASIIEAREATREATRRNSNRPAPPLLPTAESVVEPSHYAAADLTCLAKAVYFEARSETIEGQIAVAQVVMNRVRAQPTASICQIVYAGAERGEKCQFSFACHSHTIPGPSNHFWLKAQWIAADVAAGRAHLRELDAAFHYHTIAVKPIWRLTLKPVRRIGQHMFYVSANVDPDMSYAKAVRRWDEATTFEMLGENAPQPQGALLPASAPAPAIVRTPRPSASAPVTQTFNPFSNGNDSR